MLDQPGMLVWNAQNLPGFLPDEMKAAGFGWIALDLHDGLSLVEKTDYRALIAQYRSRGIEVAGWGVLRTQPQEEANLAADLCATYDLHAYIADAELEYGYTQATGPCGECFERSDRWVEAFRARTDLELALSSYSILANHDAHYVPWIQAGAAAMPQTYTNEFTWATPEAGVAGAVDLKQPHNPPNGWPRDLIYPTIGNYPVDGVHLPSAAEYADLLRQARVVSFCIYLAELVQEGELLHYAGVCVAPEPAQPPEPPEPALPPLAAEQVPYTGPYFGPSDDRGPMAGPTARALKIALRRLKVAPFPDPDDYYGPDLEEAMRTWQRAAGVRPATGHFGSSSYAALLKAIAPDGNYALSPRAIELIRGEAELKRVWSSGPDPHEGEHL
jgi:Putative peptidoglycan binding domain